MWRLATSADANDIIEMSRALYEEDPAAEPVPDEHTQRTIDALERDPVRGKAVILEVNGVGSGYAFLISFWSNELGGEVIVIDELYVKPAYRRQGYGRALIEQLPTSNQLWVGRAVALELEVTPQNSRAATLYTALGFKPIKNSRLRLLVKEAGGAP
jgi:GNAT superfamily N-acetyltransferase